MAEKPMGDSRGTKKPYQKPEVKQVPLKPDEVLSAGCKTTGTGGPSGVGCGGGTPCSNAGS